MPIAIYICIIYLRSHFGSSCNAFAFTWGVHLTPSSALWLPGLDDLAHRLLCAMLSWPLQELLLPGVVPGRRKQRQEWPGCRKSTKILGFGGACMLGSGLLVNQFSPHDPIEPPTVILPETLFNASSRTALDLSDGGSSCSGRPIVSFLVLQASRKDHFEQAEGIAKWYF